MKAGTHRRAARWLLGGLALAAAAGAARAAELERADALVGRSVTVKNVYRNAGGVTVSKLSSDADVAAARSALQAALRKYPASFIERVLSTVYVGSELRWSANAARQTDGWQGLYRYRDRTIFMKFDGRAAAFERVFHHELAHGIHFGFSERFDEAAWLAANPPGFAYTGVADAGPPSPEVYQQGFVRPYARHSLAEDVACLAECLVGDPQGFAQGLGRYERLGRKARVLIGLYQAVDPVMSAGYFRLRQDEAAREAADESQADERGRPLLVSSRSPRGAYVGTFKPGDRVTFFFRGGERPRGRAEITFEPQSPGGVALCRRRQARDEPELTALARLPRLTRDGAFTYTFKEACAAVLTFDAGGDEGAEARVRFEFQIDRSGRGETSDAR